MSDVVQSCVGCDAESKLSASRGNDTSRKKIDAMRAHNRQQQGLTEPLSLKPSASTLGRLKTTRRSLA